MATEDIAKARLAALERAGATFEKIAAELCAIGFSNIRDYLQVDKDGSVTLIGLDQVEPVSALKAIKSIKQTRKDYTYKDEPVTETKTEFTLWDKQDALWRLVELRGDKPAEKQEIKHKFGDMSDDELDARIRQLAGVLVAERG